MSAESVTHFAGPDVQCGPQLRQRCSWCGAVLVDVDLSRTATVVAEGEEPGQYPRWPMGELVQVWGDGTVSNTIDADELETHDDGSRKLPPDSCARIDHSVTGA